jgi:geranylgeranyl diphosphate synthase, type I
VEGPEILSRFRVRIENEIHGALPTGDAPLDEMIRYQMGWTPDGLMSLGKWLRPALCLTACEALGGDVERCLPVAASIEMVHNFSLIHDDIEDGDEVRHHRPALWNVYGRGPAIAAGTALWTLAYETLTTSRERGLPADRVLAARRLLNDACTEMVEGQDRDISFEQRNDVTLNEYLEMVNGKTAALLSASLALGALVAGADALEQERFALFGREMGLAFQIRDDILGIWGEGSATGKPVGADIERRKKTLPVVHAFAQAVGGDRETLRHVYSKDEVDGTDVDTVLDILQRWNSRYFAQGLAEDHRATAMGALARTSIAFDSRVMFDDLTQFILERDF